MNLRACSADRHVKRARSTLQRQVGTYRDGMRLEGAFCFQIREHIHAGAARLHGSVEIDVSTLPCEILQGACERIARVSLRQVHNKKPGQRAIFEVSFGSVKPHGRSCPCNPCSETSQLDVSGSKCPDPQLS